MVKIYNVKTEKPPAEAVNIMRPSKWGNPFILYKHGNRAEVIGKFRNWLSNNPELLASVEELRGKDLACCCKPFSCHGDVYFEILYGEDHTHAPSTTPR